MKKEFLFFTYLIESYANYKNMSTLEVLELLEKNNAINFVYNMYEMYHQEAIENAFKDIDSLIKTGKPAY